MSRLIDAAALFFAFAGWLAGNSVRMACQPEALSLLQGEKAVLQVTVSNGSAFNLSSAGGFSLSFHACNAGGKVIRFENRRFPFPRDIGPGRSATFAWPVFFDLQDGSYRLQLDIVKEGEFWGSQRQWQTPWLRLELKPLVSPGFRASLLKTHWRTGNPLIDFEQYLLRLTLKNAELGKPGSLFGFAAGTAYPAVWIRDTATFVGYARCFYPWRTLAGTIELFLNRQKESGEIADWIDEAGRTGKNTVETDQESSLVLAAAEIALGNPAWLESSVKGRSVFARLEAALEWVWWSKRDPATGLVTSGFTADWGDVENSYPDQRAVSLSDRSTPVVAIYTQALYIQAVAELRLMALRMGERGIAAKWQERESLLRDRTRRFLYLPEAGYFLVHRIVDSDRFLELEKGMVALGGNAEAMAAGLLQPAEIAKFIAVLEARRKEYALPTVSFTLLPPYPDGFFPHPLLARPWTYQNGGAWDWIGGRLIRELFRFGFRREAERYLLEILARHRRDLVIFEWHDRRGNGQGALFYVGAAGVIGEAILKGYLGVGEEFDRYILPPPAAGASLHFWQEGSEFSIAAGRGVEISGGRTRKKVCVLPRGRREAVCLNSGRAQW